MTSSVPPDRSSRSETPGVPDTAIVRPPAVVLAEIELILSGAYTPLTGPLDQAEEEKVRQERRLVDGTPWPVAVTLPLSGEEPHAGRLVIADAEGTPIASLSVEETTYDSAAGVLSRLGPPPGGVYADLRRTPAEMAELRDGRRLIAMVLHEPLQNADVEALSDAATALDADILLLPATAGAGTLGIAPHTLVRSVLAAVPLLPDQARPLVVPVPLPCYPDPLRRALTGVHVAAAYGADFVLLGADDVTGSSSDELPVPVLLDADGLRTSTSDIRAALDSGDGVLDDVFPAPVAAELRKARPPRAQRGLTVFFTGLSGSGKSTLARALNERLLERGEVTLLDGDVVRELLSRGLGFSQEDRDLNVRRIGFVAAEVSRHGGTCVAAPIAPYASSRAAVRDMVTGAGGGFVLVHVATTLAECERRDVKGLYARARSGALPAFTGISDPYEEPDDADVVVDTARLSVEQCVELVLAEVRRQGWLALPAAELGGD